MDHEFSELDGLEMKLKATNSRTRLELDVGEKHDASDDAVPEGRVHYSCVNWTELPKELWSLVFLHVPPWFLPLVAATCRCFRATYILPGNFPRKRRLSCTAAAGKGWLRVLQWGRARGCAWDEVTSIAAAAAGQLDVLKWARAKGCPWDERVCHAAAGGGHLEVLKWVREQGCPWTEKTCIAAAAGGYLELLQWMREEGCPWNEKTSSAAAAGGHLEVLKWVRQGHVCWDRSASTAAAARGQLEVLKWLVAENCEWYKPECARAAKRRGHREVEEYIAVEIMAQGPGRVYSGRHVCSLHSPHRL